MTTASFLFGGATPTSFTNQSVSTASLPDWYQDAIKGLIGQASAIAAGPFQAYQGPRVAGQNQYQTQAATEAANNAGQGTAALNTAGNYLAKGAGDFNNDQFHSYLDPLLQGSQGELDTIARLGTRNLNEDILPKISDSFISSGMFGSHNRLNDITARALRDSNESILNQQSGVVGNAYKTAMDSYNTAQGRNLQAGQLQGALGALMPDVTTRDVSNLTSVGNALQNQQQRNLDTAYGDFTKQTEYPLEQLNNISAMVRGYQPPSTTVSNTTNPQNYTATNTTQGGAQGALSSLGSLLGL